MEKNKNISKSKIARIISDVISPPLVYALMGFFLSWSELSFWDGLIWGIIYGFFVSLVPVIAVFYLYKNGKVQDMHISRTEQRRLPYLLSIFGAVFVIIFLVLFEGPKFLLLLAICNFLGLSILFTVNFFWLISSHMASICMASFLLTILFGYRVGLYSIPLVLMVFWARTYLRRHSTLQLIAGMIVGIMSVIIFIGFGGTTTILTL